MLPDQAISTAKNDNPSLNYVSNYFMHTLKGREITFIGHALKLVVDVGLEQQG